MVYSGDTEAVDLSSDHALIAAADEADQMASYDEVADDGHRSEPDG